MPVTITDQDEFNIESLSATEARALLQELEVNLRGTDGQTKTGTLNIVHRGGRWEIRRQSLWSRFWNYGFQHSIGPERTRRVLRAIVGRATAELNAPAQEKLLMLLDKGEPIRSEQIQGKLNRCLARRREERSAEPFQRGMSESELLGKLGVPTRNLNSLFETKTIGKGNCGSIAPIGPDANGTPRILKIERDPVKMQTGPACSLRQGEVSAAYLQSHRTGQTVPGVAVPTHFVFQDGRRYHLVPAEAVKAFLRNSRSKNLQYRGQVLPRVPGSNLFDALHGIGGAKPPGRGQQKMIARQMLEILIELAARGFVHHDLKLANFIWDPESKRLTLVDTGLLEKVSKHDNKGRTTNTQAGSPITLHPAVYDEQPHASEADGFAAAMTLLMLNLDWQDPGREISDFRGIFTDGAWGRLQRKDLRAGQESYLSTWLGGVSSSMITKERLERYQQRIGKPGEVRPTLENFCHQLIQASFLPTDQYREQLGQLLHHPYIDDFND